MKELSKVQKVILNYIKNFTIDNGYPPSVRQIGQNSGLSSPSSVKHQLDRLVLFGYLNKADGIARGLTIKNSEY